MRIMIYFMGSVCLIVVESVKSSTRYCKIWQRDSANQSYICQNGPLESHSGHEQINHSNQSIYTTISSKEGAGRAPEAWGIISTSVRHLGLCHFPSQARPAPTPHCTTESRNRAGMWRMEGCLCRLKQNVTCKSRCTTRSGNSLGQLEWNVMYAMAGLWIRQVLWNVNGMPSIV